MINYRKGLAKSGVIMKRKNSGNNLCKIVYFDEDSVTDYVQIIKGGVLEKTTELLSQSSTDGEAGIEADAKVGIGGALKALLGYGVSASIDSKLHTAFNTQDMAKNIIKNTILSDFIDVIEGDNISKKGTNGSIRKFNGYKISVSKESLTYIALIAPYLSMIKSGSGIQAGEFDIAIDKIDNTMKSAKGYYEFIGTKGRQPIIFRFNIKSFKNNYRVADLLKMNICIYAIKVGKTTIDQLNFNNEFDIQESLEKKDNPSYVENERQTRDEEKGTNKILDVYDVLLAGVESNG